MLNRIFYVNAANYVPKTPSNKFLSVCAAHIKAAQPASQVPFSVFHKLSISYYAAALSSRNYTQMEMKRMRGASRAPYSSAKGVTATSRFVDRGEINNISEAHIRSAGGGESGRRFDRLRRSGVSASATTLLLQSVRKRAKQTQTTPSAPQTHNTLQQPKQFLNRRTSSMFGGRIIILLLLVLISFGGWKGVNYLTWEIKSMHRGVIFICASI